MATNDNVFMNMLADDTEHDAHVAMWYPHVLHGDPDLAVLVSNNVFKSKLIEQNVIHNLIFALPIDVGTSLDLSRGLDLSIHTLYTASQSSTCRWTLQIYHPNWNELFPASIALIPIASIKEIYGHAGDFSQPFVSIIPIFVKRVIWCSEASILIPIPTFFFLFRTTTSYSLFLIDNWCMLMATIHQLKRS